MRPRQAFCLIILLASLLMGLSSSASPPLTGVVRRVLDGDTIRLDVAGRAVTVRLTQIDAPEKTQPGGSSATNALIVLVLGQTVTVTSHGTDRYGRVLGEVWLSDGRSVNTEMVRQCLVWWYRRYAPQATQLRDLEAACQAAHQGVWAGDNAPIPPWDWRKGRRQ